MLQYLLKTLFLTVSISTLAQQAASVKNEAMQLKNLILEHHFDPRPVDDVFSSKVFVGVPVKLVVKVDEWIQVHAHPFGIRVYPILQ